MMLAYRFHPGTSEQGIVSKLSIEGKYADLYYTPDQEDAFSHQIAASLYNENHDRWSFQ